MDRRLSPGSRWNRDRRTDCGPELTALLSARSSATFDELVDAAGVAQVADVATWLAHATVSGLVEEVPPEDSDGSRRFRLRRTVPAERRTGASDVPTPLRPARRP